MQPIVIVNFVKLRMKKAIADFLKDIARQIVGWNTPRNGKLVLTRNAIQKMQEYQLDVETLKDVFRHGEEENKRDKQAVTRKYANYSVGLWYKVIYTPFHKHIPPEKRFLIITCWKSSW